MFLRNLPPRRVDIETDTHRDRHTEIDRVCGVVVVRGRREVTQRGLGNCSMVVCREEGKSTRGRRERWKAFS